MKNKLLTWAPVFLITGATVWAAVHESEKPTPKPKLLRNMVNLKVLADPAKEQRLLEEFDFGPGIVVGFPEGLPYKPFLPVIREFAKAHPGILFMFGRAQEFRDIAKARFGTTMVGSGGFVSTLLPKTQQRPMLESFDQTISAARLRLFLEKAINTLPPVEPGLEGATGTPTYLA